MAGCALQDLVKEATLHCHKAINSAEVSLFVPAAQLQNKTNPWLKLQISVLKGRAHPKLQRIVGRGV